MRGITTWVEPLCSGKWWCIRGSPPGIKPLYTGDHSEFAQAGWVRLAGNMVSLVWLETRSRQHVRAISLVISEVAASVGDARQRGTSPPAKVVVPKVLEGGFMVDLGFVGYGWDPNVRHEVGVVVLVEGLQGPWSVGQDVQVKHWVGLGPLGFLGGVEPWSWVDHVILAIGCLEASLTEEECVGLVEVRVLGIHWHDEVFGKTLLAVLALKFLGVVVVGNLVVTLKVLGEVGPGWNAQVPVLGGIEVRLEEVVEVLLGLGHRR